jgi:hypothetical protein
MSLIVEMASFDEHTMCIHLKNGSTTFKLEVPKAEKIQNLKNKLSALTKVRANNLLVLLDGCFLDNDSTLEEYDISDDATLLYEIRLCGPKPADFDWSKFGVPAAPKKNSKALVKKVTEI